MNNVHQDYLLKRFREERSDIHAALSREMVNALEDRRMLMMVARFRSRCDAMFGEIEYQIERAFDDMAKEGGAP